VRPTRGENEQFRASHFCDFARVCWLFCFSRSLITNDARRKGFLGNIRENEEKIRQEKKERASETIKRKEVRDFEKFLKKEVWPLVRRIPGKWKTVDQWQEERRAGKSPEQIWNKIPNQTRAVYAWESSKSVAGCQYLSASHNTLTRQIGGDYGKVAKG